MGTDNAGQQLTPTEKPCSSQRNAYHLKEQRRHACDYYKTNKQ